MDSTLQLCCTTRRHGRSYVPTVLTVCTTHTMIQLEELQIINDVINLRRLHNQSLRPVIGWVGRLLQHATCQWLLVHKSQCIPCVTVVSGDADRDTSQHQYNSGARLLNDKYEFSKVHRRSSPLEDFLSTDSSGSEKMLWLTLTQQTALCK